ncbi:UNVERIFIED_CONTAM: hypothetical protein GTU68_017692 [Idotea baltica]|nr:hypothetical protein [Idotea baltica]
MLWRGEKRLRLLKSMSLKVKKLL